MPTANQPTHIEQQRAVLAACIYMQASAIHLKWVDISAAIRCTLAEFDHGFSAASAYEVGVKAIKTIAGYRTDLSIGNASVNSYDL